MQFTEQIIQEYLKRKRKNPAYSLRAFASTLEVDQSLLSKILKGKRNASSEFILKASQKLGFDSETIKLYLKAEANKQQVYTDLDIEAGQLLSNWEHFAIMELMKTKDFSQDTKWIAKRLNLNTYQVEDAIERLKKFSYIEEVEGRWQLKNKNHTWTQFSSTTEARKILQKNLLQKAQEAIDYVDFSERENASLTIQCSPSLLPKIKEKMAEFRHSLDKFIEDQGQHEEVYQMVLGFYPLSKKEEV